MPGIVPPYRLVFHHLKQEKLECREKKELEKTLDFAKTKEVEMIYESNKNFSSETCLDTLSSFPHLKYNLDLGHLNTAIGNKTLKMDLGDFMKKIKTRTVYIHAHNNNGKQDEHNSLEKGTLDWKSTLDRLDLSTIRKIIIENRTTEDILKTKKQLQEYLKKQA